MPSPRRDWTRLVALVLLLAGAAVARSGLEVDTENLAMKSVGTATSDFSALRDRQFGHDVRVFLLASPVAPDVYSAFDQDEIEEWVRALGERPEVERLEDGPSPNVGEHCVSASLRSTEDGRYADAVRSFEAAARDSLPATYRLAVSGVPAVEVAISEEVRAERERILPVLAGVLALVLLLVYENPVLVLGALVAPLTGVWLLEGLQGLLGLGIDPVSALLGPSILTVGVASSVHVLERYHRALETDASVGRASLTAARDLRVPFALAVATTVAGFLGLLASPIPAVRRFGVLASVGVVLTTGTTLLCLPSLLRLLHRPRRRPGSRSYRAALESSSWLARSSGAIVVLAAVAAGLGGAALRETRLDSDPVHVLAPDHPARRDSETIARRLGGSQAFELLLPPHGPTDPFSLMRLVASVTALDGVLGPVGRPRRSDEGYQLLSFLLAPGGSAVHEATFAAAGDAARAAGWTGAGATGLAVRVARDSNDLVRGQRRGVLATLAALWLVMAIGFRSPRLGLLGLVPNVLPLVLVQGAMGVLDRPLTVASSMIATVMLGLVVDDTIHLLHTYRESRGSPVRRMARTLSAVGRPIVITTVVLCTGFSATLIGRLDATREFGLLAVGTLVVALAADLFLLPALIAGRRPSFFRVPSESPRCIESPRTTS